MTALLQHLLSVPAWVVLLVVGAVVFAEDALFVGFVLPGETAALIGGVAAKLGHVPLWAVLVTVVLAAIIGDSVGYEVGRNLGSRLLAWPGLDRQREGIGRAQDLLIRRGGWAIFLGRWVALLRAVMPALAGTARMPYQRFLTFNALGGLTWGITVVVLGYLAGASYDTVSGVLGKGVAIAAAAVIVLGLIGWRVARRVRQPITR